MSSLKFITSKDAPIISSPRHKSWVDNRDRVYEQLNVANKLAFLLDQSLIINYLERAYSGFIPGNEIAYDTGILYLITNYKNDFIIPALADIARLAAYEDDNSILRRQLDQVQIVAGVSTDTLDSDLCVQILTNNPFDNMVKAYDITFYRPYLLFLERVYKDSTIEIDHVSDAKNFTVSDMVTIPSFSITQSNIIVVSYEQRFSSYKYDAKKHTGLEKTLQIKSPSILSFLYGYDWSTWSFHGLLGVLAGMCLELDANAIPSGSLMRLYYTLYRVVFGWAPHAHTRANSSIGLSSDIAIIKRCVLTFIAAVCERYKTKIDNTEVLATLATLGDDASTNNLHSYLSAKDTPDTSSVEMYTNFKKSVLGTFEELGFIKSKEQSLNQLVALQARFDKEVSASIKNAKYLDELDPYLADSTVDFTAINATGTGTTTAAAGGYYNADTEQPAGTEDPEDPEEAVEPESPDSDDVNPSSDPTTMPGGDNEEMEDDEDTHTQEPLPVVGDKRGIRLILSGDENTDTVLYRFELKAYVDGLLANPPKYLDVQTINYLKRLKAFWWNCLSVQTLYDVLNSMVKLPKEYRIKKVKR